MKIYTEQEVIGLLNMFVLHAKDKFKYTFSLNSDNVQEFYQSHTCEMGSSICDKPFDKLDIAELYALDEHILEIRTITDNKSKKYSTLIELSDRIDRRLNDIIIKYIN